MKQQLINQIISYTHNCPENQYAEIGSRFFDDPVIRFADAADPLFNEYKTLIGAFHNTPKEAYELTFGANTFKSGSVISIMLPTAAAIRESNRKQTEWASKEWAIARAYNDDLYAAVAGYTINLLTESGYHGVYPLNANGYKVISDGEHFASTWSERHIAYAAGHGTFGLNDGFITEKGIAVKFVSVVTDLQVEADKRQIAEAGERNATEANERRTAEANERKPTETDNRRATETADTADTADTTDTADTADTTETNGSGVHTANCLFYVKGTCGACIKRCPVGAITETGHNKKLCYQRCYGEESRNVAVSYGGSAKAGAGCALCQAGVPCEFTNPVK
jgi:ferredoxin